MVTIHVQSSGFVDEQTLRFIDEGHTLDDENVGAQAEELAASITTLCADGATLANVERVCSSICAFVALVEQCAYVAGACAQRDGKHVVRECTADEKRWNTTAIDDFGSDQEGI